MDPISAVEARIGAIEARFGAPTSAPAGGRAGADFAAVLAAATTRTPGVEVAAGPPAPALAAALALAPGPTDPASTWPPTAGGPTPANLLAPGRYPHLSPPAELVGYGNGRIPPTALQPIDASGSHRLWAPAAAAFTALEADAARAGIRIGVTDSYRPYEVQERLAREKGLYAKGGLAATPGTSNHGWGLAVDLRLDAAGQAWMREHAWRYGFVEDVPREPWHWTYRPAGNGS
jgi:zinc D-Ala-D-Ala carboxypeptidase